MASLKLDPQELLPVLVAALQHPEVRHALGLDAAPAAAPDPRYMTDEEYGQRLRVATRTVRKWRGRGLPVVRIGSVVRVRVAEADAWVLAGGSVRLAVVKTLRELEIKRVGRR
jgi:hypothetical protein